MGRPEERNRLRRRSKDDDPVAAADGDQTPGKETDLWRDRDRLDRSRTIIGLCLWRHRRTLHSLRKRYGTKGTVPADNRTDNKIHREEGPGERRDNEMVLDEDRQESNLKAHSKTVVFQ
jgi:hypothetical protein